jgi:cell division transport system ATP-binding protein
MNSVILLNNVTINQNGIDVLKDVNLSINKGEFIYLIGKTGIGKSSLLKIL